MQNAVPRILILSAYVSILDTSRCNWCQHIAYTRMYKNNNFGVAADLWWIVLDFLEEPDTNDDFATMLVLQALQELEEAEVPD